MVRPMGRNVASVEASRFRRVWLRLAALAAAVVAVLVTTGAALSWAARVGVQVVVYAVALLVLAVYAWHIWPLALPALRWVLLTLTP